MSSKVRETIESDMAAWDAALRLARERKSDKKRRHEQMKNDLLEEERRWQQECERLRREGADVVKGEAGLSPCQCMHG
jgi:predicted  nucleic acid-binding Zn-ribbon protein